MQATGPSSGLGTRTTIQSLNQPEKRNAASRVTSARPRHSNSLNGGQSLELKVTKGRARNVIAHPVFDNAQYVSPSSLDLIKQIALSLTRTTAAKPVVASLYPIHEIKLPCQLPHLVRR